jgi:CheY-like chemotaxis protein
VEKGKARILVVDDDERALRLIEAMLAPKGYETILAKGGKEAVDIARSQKPDLILLDIMMPGMDGYTTLQTIKQDKASANIPVIMVSAVGFELNKELANQLGAAGYIAKPVDLAELQGTIARFLKSAK